MFDKGGQRDLGQALANGGAATVFGVCGGIAMLAQAQDAVSMLCVAAAVGALASANADTWATELGVLSTTAPRLITNPRRTVEAGTSGGITVTGTLAAAIGALVIGLAYLIVWLLTLVLSGQITTLTTSGTVSMVLFNTASTTLITSLGLLVSAIIGGLAGSLLDSLLGATLQVMYYSDQRNKPTERKIERNGSSNRYVRGWRWMNNDWVNFISTVGGAVVSALVFVIIAA